MIYLRTEQGSRDMSVTMARICCATAMIAYPAGALLLALGPDTLAVSVAGYGLILLALLAYTPLIGTTLQRIVAEDPKVLDEYELRLRGRALSVSYATFAALVLLLVLYSAIASDKGFWFPKTYDAFNGVFWGLFLYASVLPTAVLSWLVDPAFSGE